MTRSRLLAIAAVISLIAAGAVLNHRQATKARSIQRTTPTPTLTPTAAITATPTATTSTSPAARIAETYTLAATNWSARTYAAAYQRRLRLASLPLAANLRRERPTGAEPQQLRADLTSRLGAVMALRTLGLGPKQARVLVDVDELHLEAGRRSRQTVRYEVRLIRQRGSWRVAAFSAIGSGR